MKKYFLLTTLFLIVLSCKSQIVNLKDWDGEIIANNYYKDVDNELNQFEGTYRYINGNDELTLVIKKHEYFSIGDYTEDLLTAEFKYKKNGVVLFDNLNRINDNLPNKYSHDICGNTLITNEAKPSCNDCSQNQLRARLIFFGRSNNNHGGSIVIKKFFESGLEKIKIIILYSLLPIDENSSEPLPVLIPGSEYIILTRLY